MNVKPFRLPEKKSYKKMDIAILKQTIRDLASKEMKTRIEANKFIQSNSFYRLCERLNLNTPDIKNSLHTLMDYPLISRKALSEEIARFIDKEEF
tara:strand:- start:298 stop:582 length:285 start_codon:yes stop_codon:yes gene_type:complete